MPTRPSAKCAVSEAAVLVISRTCTFARQFLRAMAGITSETAAIEEADKCLNSVIELLLASAWRHLSVVAPNRFD
jgi:hypothetical protein